MVTPPTPGRKAAQAAANESGDGVAFDRKSAQSATASRSHDVVCARCSMRRAAQV